MLMFTRAYYSAEALLRLHVSYIIIIIIIHVYFRPQSIQQKLKNMLKHTKKRKETHRR